MTSRLRRLGPTIFVVGLAALGCRGRAGRLSKADASAVAAGPAEEETEVHFTFTGPTAVTFSWRGSGRSVRLWSRSSPPRAIQAHAPVPEPFSGPGPWKEATVTGLDTQCRAHGLTVIFVISG